MTPLTHMQVWRCQPEGMLGLFNTVRAVRGAPTMLVTHQRSAPVPPKADAFAAADSNAAGPVAGSASAGTGSVANCAEMETGHTNNSSGGLHAAG